MAQVTVIIPTYNPGDFFARALDSVVSQTFSDWELIVIDDGSRPEEWEKVRGAVACVQEQHPQLAIRVLHQKNAGVSATRNRAVLMATTPWIAFLDNDDIWLPTKLEKQMALLAQHPDVALCHTGFDLIDENDQRSTGYGRRVSFHEMLSGEFGVLLSSSVMSRSALVEVGLFDPFLPGAQDLDVFFKLAQRFGLVYVDSVETLYRLHGNNASSNYAMCFTEICHVLEKFRIWGEFKNDPETARAATRGLRRIRPTYANQAFQAFRVSLRSRNLGQMKTHARRCFTISPRTATRLFGGAVAGGLGKRAKRA